MFCIRSVTMPEPMAGEFHRFFFHTHVIQADKFMCNPNNTPWIFTSAPEKKINCSVITGSSIWMTIAIKHHILLFIYSMCFCIEMRTMPFSLYPVPCRNVRIILLSKGSTLPSFRVTRRAVEKKTNCYHKETVLDSSASASACTHRFTKFSSERNLFTQQQIN